MKRGESGTRLLLSGSGQFVMDVCAETWFSHPQVIRERRLRVVHGQNEARAPHHQLVIAVRQLPVQVVRGQAVAGAGACGVSADRDVAISQADVTVRQDEVRVVVLQLTLILGEENKEQVGFITPI